MFCNKCGNKLPEDVNFCNQCGARLNVDHQALLLEEDDYESDSYDLEDAIDTIGSVVDIIDTVRGFFG